MSLLTAIEASSPLAFAIIFAVALSFARADIVRCGFLSFTLYFALFLRIRFTDSAQPLFIRVIPPRLCVHGNWLLLVVVIHTVCKGVEVPNGLLIFADQSWPSTPRVPSPVPHTSPQRHFSWLRSSASVLLRGRANMLIKNCFSWSSLSGAFPTSSRYLCLSSSSNHSSGSRSHSPCRPFFGPEHVRLRQHDVHLRCVLTFLVDLPVRLERKLDRI